MDYIFHPPFVISFSYGMIFAILATYEPIENIRQTCPRPCGDADGAGL
jgi:hypothetical protein